VTKAPGSPFFDSNEIESIPLAFFDSLSINATFALPVHNWLAETYRE